MKPVLEYLPKDAEESFVVKSFEYTYYPTPWHFHPEYEIVLVTESTGKRFIGNNISNFQPGNLALIGPNLPHLYRNDVPYYEPNTDLRAKSIVVHFSENSFGHIFSSMPEAKQIKELFRKSVQGLEITGNTNKKASELLFELLELSGFARAIKLLEILQLLAASADCHFISGGGLTGINEKESERMHKVLDFLMKNFANDISRTEVAKVANMSDNAFSRYFSQRTRKTFAQYLNDLRLSHASKLLVSGEKNISEICYECGFNNVSNFNRQFKLHYGISPLAYSKTYWDKVG
ncbi:AraC family transcriptional regulator [Parasediminibacterium sp. JCM 36343]|uniref:AraC family transcriptional regulator n=1 Tax=Parasediminibacterium sp. JCM 36343 TaxID=3374279 RepID=UPI00397E33EF